MAPDIYDRTDLAAERDIRAIAHFKQAILDGHHWYLALLQAIGFWKSPEENYEERHYKYLIANEAFDWLLLAERLCDEVRDFIPEDELIDLLFFDKPPLELTKDEFKKLLGPAKYRAYLNYLYGVLVEEALLSATVDEIRKERRSLGQENRTDELDKAYRKIYSASEGKLLNEFRQEKGYPKRKSISLSERKEFSYWLFKRRVKMSDKSRTASDTQKALKQMHRILELKKPPTPDNTNE